MRLIIHHYRCDECKREGLVRAEMGKFCGHSVESDAAAECGVCLTCLRKMGLGEKVRNVRGTNRTTPKKRRRAR